MQKSFIDFIACYYVILARFLYFEKDFRVIDYICLLTSISGMSYNSIGA